MTAPTNNYYVLRPVPVKWEIVKVKAPSMEAAKAKVQGAIKASTSKSEIREAMEFMNRIQ